MFRLIKVTGESLSPAYREGDYVVITTIPFFLRRIKPGDIIVFHHEQHGMMIKMVGDISLERRYVFVIGTQEHSIDSNSFGPIDPSKIMGRVVWHIPRS